MNTEKEGEYWFVTDRKKIEPIWTQVDEMTLAQAKDARRELDEMISYVEEVF